MTETGRTLLLVDHGSRREAANALLDRVAEALRARTRDAVRVAHLEIAEPGVGAAIDACAAEGAREIVVVPWFLAAGRHTAQDIPEQVAEAGRRHPEIVFRIAEPLGLDERMVDVVLARAERARKPARKPTRRP